MVEVAREERIENFIETYYRAAAEVFEFSYGEGKSQAYAEERLKEALRSLDKLDINVDVDEEKISKIIEVQRKLEALGAGRELEEKASKLEGVDFFGKQEITKYAKMISMSDSKFENWLLLNKEFRTLLRAMISSKRASKTKKTDS